MESCAGSWKSKAPLRDHPLSPGPSWRRARRRAPALLFCREKPARSSAGQTGVDEPGRDRKRKAESGLSSHSMAVIRSCWIAFKRYHRRLVPSAHPLFPALPPMPCPLSRRPFSPDAMKLSSPFLNFDDSRTFSESDQMIFGPLDLEDVNGLHPSPIPYQWDSFDVEPSDVKPPLSFSALSALHTPDYAHAQLSPTGSYYDSVGLPYTSEDFASSPSADTTSYLATWLNDPEIAASSPINIPSSLESHQQTSFIPFADHSHFPSDGPFSPMSPSNMSLDSHARSISPSPPFEDAHPARHRVLSINPTATSVHTPAWATQLWDSPSTLRSPTSTRPSVRHSPFPETTLRTRIPMRRGSISSGQMFQSSSAPTVSEPRAPSMARSYSRRAESISTNDDRDATLRRRRKPEESPTPEKGSDTRKSNSLRNEYRSFTQMSLALKSVLKPPKLAPSAWQLYFTDWIQRQQASGTRKLNVAQAAKEAGQEYACLSPDDKEVRVL